MRPEPTGSALPTLARPLTAPARTRPVTATPIETLSRLAAASAQQLDLLAARPLPEDVAELVDTYALLGWAQARAEATLLGALDALDPRTGGGVAQPESAYRELRRRAFDLLARAGELYDRFEPAFARLVHGGSAWPAQPTLARADRGDGRPLYYYRNTYKRAQQLPPAQRRAEHEARVRRFEAEGGRWSDLITATPGIFDRLPHNVRYDYVLLADGTLRLCANDDSVPAKPGHSLLATGGREYDEAAVLLAGELWVYRDSAGDTEAVVIANNSGHFKPEFEDLVNALPPMQRLGLDPSLALLFGGPNNLDGMFEEIGENCHADDARSRLPPDARELLAAAVAAQETLLSVRSWRPPGGGSPD